VRRVRRGELPWLVGQHCITDPLRGSAGLRDARAEYIILGLQCYDAISYAIPLDQMSLGSINNRSTSVSPAPTAQLQPGPH
jgi:hypothetical protein